VIAVMITITFLGQVVNWNGDTNLLISGIAIAAVIAAITFFFGWKMKRE
jgi:hypothetical protein